MPDVKPGATGAGAGAGGLGGVRFAADKVARSGQPGSGGVTTANGLAAFAGSHPGLQRDHNEDRCHADAERGIFFVVDGVGGQAAGDQAADIAERLLLARLERETGATADRIREAITLANNEIYATSQTNPALNGMACVLTVAIVRDGRVTVGHVGDSRLYKMRGGTVRKVTHDHSPVGDREDRGEIGEAEAMRHPRRNEIFRDVGSEPHSPTDEEFIDLVEFTLEPDSALLLCTDGLTDLVSSSQIAGIVRRHAGNPEAVVDALLGAANEAGGKDNVSAVFVEGQRFAAATRAATRTTGAGWFTRLFVGGGNQESGIRSQESGIRSQESGIRSQDSGVGSREPGIGNTNSGRQGQRDALAESMAHSRWVALGAGIVLGIALLLAALAWTRQAPLLVRDLLRGSWPRTWVVSQDGTGDFTSISKAVERARSGDTVDVEPGEYAEHLVLTGSIALVSVVPHAAVIVPPTDGSGAATAVELHAGGVRFSGFRVAGDETRPVAVGIRLRRAGGEIDGVEVSGARMAGIEIDGQSTATIRSSYIHDNPGFAIVIGQSARPKLLHNVISDNGRQAEAKPALDIGETARPVLFGNIIANNALDVIRGLSAAQREEVARNNVVGRPAPAAPAGRGMAPTGRRPR